MHPSLRRFLCFSYQTEQCFRAKSKWKLQRVGFWKASRDYRLYDWYDSLPMHILAILALVVIVMFMVFFVVCRPKAMSSVTKPEPGHVSVRMLNKGSARLFVENSKPYNSHQPYTSNHFDPAGLSTELKQLDKPIPPA